MIGIDQNKHRNPDTTWWNTYLVSYHFNEQLLPALHQYGNVTEFYEKLGWTEEELQAEIMFTEETLQEKIKSMTKLIGTFLSDLCSVENFYTRDTMTQILKSASFATTMLMVVT